MLKYRTHESTAESLRVSWTIWKRNIIVYNRPMSIDKSEEKVDWKDLACRLDDDPHKDRTSGGIKRLP